MAGDARRSRIGFGVGVGFSRTGNGEKRKRGRHEGFVLGSGKSICSGEFQIILLASYSGF
ncbi:hypothetical protein EYF80_046124 [Liparis tanakae]|uniref:Uncharacterized protein n=1 Tax=Liparis tanakae TaxID=230148 RepID=A0A4Z2FRR0_9TELE|nr:hypothetical protein EYF80_046124 [Liparis tanakae]